MSRDQSAIAAARASDGMRSVLRTTAERQRMLAGARDPKTMSGASPSTPAHCAGGTASSSCQYSTAPARRAMRMARIIFSAAGRSPAIPASFVSSAAASMARRPASSDAASCAASVILPLPCGPTISTTIGARLLSSAAVNSRSSPSTSG